MSTKPRKRCKRRRQDRKGRSSVIVVDTSESDVQSRDTCSQSDPTITAQTSVCPTVGSTACTETPLPSNVDMDSSDEDLKTSCTQMPLPFNVQTDSSDEDSNPMTFKEKIRLSRAVNKLSADQLGRLVQILQRREPSIRDSNPDEIEVDFDQLRLPTLRELERFVAKCNNKKLRQRRKKPRLYSLVQQCTKVLQKNIHCIGNVDGLPFYILKRVLEKCSPEQLYWLESKNPRFIQDSDYLWKLHCESKFTDCKAEESDSWRNLYLRFRQDSDYLWKLLCESKFTDCKAEESDSWRNLYLRKMEVEKGVAFTLRPSIPAGQQCVHHS